ncbi:hypothetical protein [Flavobacterium faecale]|uniref:hypothetical protein n=1 Tax=Flavobacterium faecale TaxID=1355330 RepID=UPI003AAD2FBB
MIEKDFFIDTLKIMPENSICYLQAPNLSSKLLLRVLQDSEYEYYLKIKLDNLNRKLLINCILSENIQEDLQSIEIKKDDELLFEGFDGVEYGTISNKLKLTEDYIKKYINDDFCNISNDW